VPVVREDESFEHLEMSVCVSVRSGSVVCVEE
jgi:hypothetical protein